MNKIMNSAASNNALLEYEPVCTVLLSTYNGEKYVAEQVESIINQVQVKCKIIIRDDGSKDNTMNLLRAMQKKYPTAITVIEGKNVGIHGSFKELMLNATECEYVAFSDQDDIWDRDKLAVAVSAMQKDRCDLYSCASRIVDEHGVSLGMTTSNGDKYRYYMLGNSKVLSPGAQGCTMVMTYTFFRSILDKGIPEDYGHDTWIPIVAYYLGNSIYDPQPHMSYRQHNRSWTGNRKKKAKQLFVDTRYFFKGLSRYKPLAQDVLDRFSDLIGEADKAVLRSIASADRSAVKRLRTIMKYRFGKYGWKENMVYAIHYIVNG